MSSFTVGLVVIAIIVSLPALINLLRRPDVRRMAIRNIVRRPVESVLIIVGSALGTAIIVAALMVGDTFDNTIRDLARTRLGEIDLVVEFEGPAELAAARESFAQAEIEGVDGHLALRRFEVAAAGSGLGDGRKVEPSISVAALDFGQAAVFGSEPDRYAFAEVAVPAEPNQVVINTDLAKDLAVDIGDDISLFALGQEISLEVVDLLDAVGLGGNSSAFVSPDLINQIDPAGTFTFDHLAISATGTVFDSVDSANGVLDNLGVFSDANAAEWEVNPVKDDLLLDAEQEGAELTQIFSVVGGFSVLAGVLLLINLFVMLAEERKPSLGVLRAIGWKRSVLRRAFRAEGVIYAAVAAVVGAVLGIGVGWVIVQLTRGILAGSNPDSDFRLQLAIWPESLLQAALFGLIIAMGAIWFTSWRISRLNIISAIRDLPEPKTRRSRLLVMGAAAVLVVAGSAMLMAGLSSNSAFLTIVSVPLASLAVAMLAKDVLSPLVAAGAAGLASVIWGVSFFPLMPAEMTDEVEIEFFLIFGVVIVAGGVAVATVLGPTIQRLFSQGNRPMVEARVAMAYPSARMFRTAASLAMYGLIIFTLAFMAVLSHSFSLQTTDLADSTAAGHDVFVTVNRTNPIPEDELIALDGVRATNPLLRGRALFSSSWNDEELDDEWGFVGVTESFASVGSPVLRTRSDRFATDQQALEAVAADPALALVPEWFLNPGDGKPDPPIGAAMTATSAVSGETVTFEVVGVLSNDLTFGGAWISADAARALAPEAQANRLFVAADEGVDTRALAETIEARFLANGASAETFDDRIRRFAEADAGFFSLLRGYLLLGLVIGIAGLAVTLFRAVRERRRQIGMMRAMGLLNTGVRRWFMTEATFISVMGIATGVGLGMLTGFLSVTRSTAFDEKLPFGVPWGVIAFITLVPLAASILAATIPARRAASLQPSEALRLAD